MKILPSTSGNRQILADLLAKVEVGNLTSYDVLERAIGVSVRTNSAGRSALYAAFQKVRKLHGLVFEARRNEGYLCLNDTGKIGATHARVRRSRNQARRGLEIASTVNIGALDNSLRIEHLTNISLLGAVRQSTSVESVKVEHQKAKAQLLSLPKF